MFLLYFMNILALSPLLNRLAGNYLTNHSTSLYITHTPALSDKKVQCLHLTLGSVYTEGKGAIFPIFTKEFYI